MGETEIKTEEQGNVALDGGSVPVSNGDTTGASPQLDAATGGDAVGANDSTADAGNAAGVHGGDSGHDLAGVQTGTGGAPVTETPKEEKSDETDAVQEKEEGREGVLAPNPASHVVLQEGTHYLVNLNIDKHDLGLKPKFTEAKVVEGKLVNMWTQQVLTEEEILGLQFLGTPSAE